MLTGSFRNTLLATKLSNNGQWYENERGRYLCTAGRSYGKTDYSWMFNDTELNIILQLPEDNEESDCVLKDGCELACLKALVSQLVSDCPAEPCYVTIEHSACLNDKNVDSVNEFFSYVSVLMFGEISAENEGTYLFAINGSVGKFGTYDKTEANITVSKPSIDGNVEIRVGNLMVPPTFELVQDKLLVCHGNHISFNGTPQWFKDDELIGQVDYGASGCHDGVDMYYTVLTERTSTTDYDNSYFELSIYSSNATLHWCNTTQVTEGYYSCRLSNSAEFKGVQVTVPPSVSSTPSKSSNTEQLLIIWFGVLNAILILAIVITLTVWCWMRCSSSKHKSVHSMYDVGLPVYLHNSLELETSFTQDGGDPLEFPFDQLEFLHLLGL